MILTDYSIKKLQLCRHYVAFLLLLALLILALLVQTGQIYADTPDVFEPDNSYSEAQLVVLDPVDIPTQQHSFDRYFDEDWLQFYAQQSGNYLIFATPLTGSSDTVIELFNVDGVNQLLMVNQAGPGEGEILGWKCPEDGYYYVRLTNDSIYYGPDNKYTVYLKQWAPIIIKFSGYIAGRLTHNGQGVGNVRIEAGSGVGLSNSDGSYILSLDTGPVDVHVRKDGYLPRTYSTTVISDQTTRLNIAIEKIKGSGSPPVINGTPQISSIPGRLYSFVPDASDPDGDSMQFSITGKPGWASFNPDNGMLLGVPSESDIGSYGQIIITVADSQGLSSALPGFTLEVRKSTGSVSPQIFLLLEK